MTAGFRLGDLVPCDILPGDVVPGHAAGLSDRYTLRGVGLVRTRSVYTADELTECCQDTDTCWTAAIIGISGGTTPGHAVCAHDRDWTPADGDCSLGAECAAGDENRAYSSSRRPCGLCDMIVCRGCGWAEWYQCN